MTDIILHGCGGKMGRVVADIVKNDPDSRVVAGIDVYAKGDFDFPVFSSLNECDVKGDVIIDFSTAVAVPDLMEWAVKVNTPVVVCTTGLDEYANEKLNECSKTIGVFKSANMSLGINLMAAILKKYSAALYDAGFDVEIVERHHNQKIDAPSGTAILLADAVNDGVNTDLKYVYDRSSVREKRTRDQLGISAVRGGTIVGDHEVIFAGRDEVVEFKHSAYSKEVFAIGAVKAAKFMKGKTSGKFDMQDVMNEI